MNLTRRKQFEHELILKGLICHNEVCSLYNINIQGLIVLKALYYRPLYFGDTFKTTKPNLVKFTGLLDATLNLYLTSLVKQKYISRHTENALYEYKITRKGRHVVSTYLSKIDVKRLYLKK